MKSAVAASSVIALLSTVLDRVEAIAPATVTIWFAVGEVRNVAAIVAEAGVVTPVP